MHERSLIIIKNLKIQLKIIVANVNETVILPCPARATPPPTRTWSYEGDRIFSGYNYGSVMLPKSFIRF